MFLSFIYFQKLSEALNTRYFLALIYLSLGAVAGILAGLLGIGGGLIIVPMLTHIFISQGLFYEYIFHMALGTSLASVLFTSISSFIAHHKRQAVLWKLVFKITPGILLGSFLGTWVASFFSTNFLKNFFAFFLFCVATKMFLDIKPRPVRKMPGRGVIVSTGSIIGIVSSLMGIGGGTLSVPFLTWWNIDIHKAIGTSAAISFPIAVGGTLGYIINGLNLPDLPVSALGFVHLHALAGIVGASVLTAPIGAKMAHTLPVGKLKKIFAILLYIIGIRMIVSVF